MGHFDIVWSRHSLDVICRVVSNIRQSVHVFLLVSTCAVTPVYVTASPFPAEFELSDLLPQNGGNGTMGTVISAVSEGDQTSGVSNAGDVNADGIDDFLVGSIRAAPNGFSSGQAYLVFGVSSGFPAELKLADLFSANGGDGSRGMVMHGIDAWDRLSTSMDAAGDINQDGVDDIIVSAVGAAFSGGAQGQSYVIYGRQSGFPSEMDVAQLLPQNGGDGSIGFALTGTVTGESSGSRVSGIGDFNDDGTDDLLIGANDIAHVVFGRPDGFPPEVLLSSITGGDGSMGFSVVGPSNTGSFLRLSNHAGDINGDGLPDIIINDERNSSAGLLAGRAFVLFGSSNPFPAVIDLNDLINPIAGQALHGFVLLGDDHYEGAGRDSTGIGDVNGDGFDDVLIGTSSHENINETTPPGEAYLLYGTANGFPAEFHLADIAAQNGGDGSVGTRFSGINDVDFTGYRVSGAGDVNADGFYDFVIGAYGADINGSFSGRCYLVFGRSSGFPADVNLFSLTETGGGDGTDGVVFNGVASNDRLCGPLSAAGDVNHDGIDDLLLGAPWSDAQGNTSGQVYLIYGQANISDADNDGVADSLDNCTLSANAEQTDTDNDGYGNACDPDLNNDGVVNFLDVNLFAQRFLSEDAIADFDGDGRVNFFDFSVLSSMYLNPPGPSGITGSPE